MVEANDAAHTSPGVQHVNQSIEVGSRARRGNLLLRVLLAAVVGATAWLTVQNIEPSSRADAATITGIDVSRWQHPNGAAISWPKVRGAGHSFAVIKATEGTGYVNPYFATDYPQAKAAGLIVGAYHFAQPRLPISSAADQARHYVRTVGTFRGTGILPPVLDLECAGTGGGCTYGTTLSRTQLQQWTKLWLDTAQAMTGRVPIIYTYDSFWRNAMGNTTAFTKYPLWYARYTSTTPTAATLPGGWSRWTLWQYTSTGKVPGIVGNVDINRFNGDAASLRALADGSDALGVPVAPTRVRAVATGAGWFKAGWDAPTDNGGAPITDYLVQVDGGLPTVAPARAFYATGLSPGTHTLSILGRTIAGEGSATTIDVDVPATGASAPTSQAVISISTPASAQGGSPMLFSARLSRADTRQALSGVTVGFRQTFELGGSPPSLSLVTASDGSISRSLLPSHVDTRATVAFSGSPGLPSKVERRSTRVTPGLGVAFRDPTLRAGARAELIVKGSSRLAGERVYRQQWVSGRWTTVASLRLDAGGDARFVYSAGKAGLKRFRMVLPATDHHAKKVTAPVVLRVS
jgi:GH25 family lysozyme M1 (1,4-beta-N-acetylmuramidase)